MPEFRSDGRDHRGLAYEGRDEYLEDDTSLSLEQFCLDRFAAATIIVTEESHE